MEVWLIKLVKRVNTWSSFAGLLLCCTKLFAKLLSELRCQAIISMQCNVNTLLSTVGFSKAILSHENCMSHSVSILSGTYTYIFLLTNLFTLRACVQPDAQVLIFLFYASARTMHGSIIMPDPIPEKTIIVLMILTLCLALPYIKTSEFHVIYANDTWANQNLQRPNKNLEGPISTWLYACV